MTPATSAHTASFRPNELLGALSDDERARIAPHISCFVLKPGEVLHEAGRAQPWVYFPCGAVVSLLHVTESGNSIEIAMVGNEGMVGVANLLSGGAALDQAVVQSGGAALRVRAEEIRKEFTRGGSVQHVLLCHMQSLMAQTAQVAVCNRYHTVDRQLCRWLLMSLDRLPSNEVVVTQEMVSHMLGVRRESVATAAVALQRAGAIEYKHGHLEVINRPRLESMACECYKVARAESARLLPWSRPAVPGGSAVTAGRDARG
ncbi:MAG TPA: Crp/Fnr family transcriptional regulator [Rhodanobacter sp.]|jgi:CRP-like cAMP-binding protein|nr:Crp/Fnr family transcriptional regulator [Rhodanobacter sp.]